MSKQMESTKEQIIKVEFQIGTGLSLLQTQAHPHKFYHQES